jgi:pimeloyl-ACP methyl ester carboxylesterase
MDERMDDLRAVLDAAGSRRAAVFGISEGGALSLLFARAYPQRASAVVLYGSWARRLVGPDYPYGPTAEELDGVIARMDRAWASGEWWDGGQPSAADDEGHRIWWARYLRTAASPAMAQNVIRMNMMAFVTTAERQSAGPDPAPHRRHLDPCRARALPRGTTGCHLRRLPGTDHRPAGRRRRDHRQVERFLTGRKSRAQPWCYRRRCAPAARAWVALLTVRGETATGSRAISLSNTVESHLVSIYTKLGINSKTEMIKQTTEFGL